MSNNKSSILTVFNDHFFEFVSDVQNVFPDDVDILTTKNSLSLIRKANPKMIIKIWLSFIVKKYQKEIEAGDIRFFLEKDYSEDLQNTDNSQKIMEAINRLREPIRNMTEENQQKTVKYIQNLTKLALAYE
jgi:hypothetical protein